MTEITLTKLHESFESVKANRGGPGVDRVTIKSFEKNLSSNLAVLQDELHREIYFPLPLMQILVEKKNGEPRKLCIPALRDRVAMRAALDIVAPVLEREFEACSYAYRKGRSIRQVVELIRKLYDQGYRWVVDADIDAFFDNVDHAIMADKIRRFVADRAMQTLLLKWMRAEVWDGYSLFSLKKGIAQGSAVSPVLANLFLDELDEAMLANGFQYIRYADDYVVLAKDKQQAFKSLTLSKQVLAGMQLALDDQMVTTFDQGFKYLGVIFMRSMVMKPFEIQKRRRKVLFYPGPIPEDIWRNRMLKKG